jgi:hypothetical protein
MSERNERFSSQMVTHGLIFTGLKSRYMLIPDQGFPMIPPFRQNLVRNMKTCSLNSTHSPKNVLPRSRINEIAEQHHVSNRLNVSEILNILTGYFEFSINIRITTEIVSNRAASF